MPLILSRRTFLRQTAGGIALAASGQVRRLDAAESSVTRIALFSDTHIAADPSDTFRGFSPHANLRRAVDEAAKMRFDLAVVNGDLARQTGEADDYRAFVSLLRPMIDRVPVAMTLGNHDHRQHARSALTMQAGKAQLVDQKMASTVEVGATNLVMLDSLLATNIAPGQVGKLQSEWLTRYLDANQKSRTVVFVHHNPDQDSDNALVDAERLLSILRPRTFVKALIFGHTHVFRLENQDGLHLLNLPAVGYNFADGIPVGWLEADLSERGMRVRLHALGPADKADGTTTDLAWR